MWLSCLPFATFSPKPWSKGIIFLLPSCLFFLPNSTFTSYIFSAPHILVTSMMVLCIRILRLWILLLLLWCYPVYFELNTWALFFVGFIAKILCSNCVRILHFRRCLISLLNSLLQVLWNPDHWKGWGLVLSVKLLMVVLILELNLQYRVLQLIWNN